MPTKPSAEFTIRFAGPEDNDQILFFIQQIAAYEKMSDQVVTDSARLYDSLFVRKAAEVLIGEENGKPVGFALFFHNFSTFTGLPGLYLEDIFFMPEVRGKGYGTAMFRRLAQIAQERNCGRMEWTCLDWNEPSIKFYKGMGAVAMDEWTTYRLTKEAIEKVAENIN